MTQEIDVRAYAGLTKGYKLGNSLTVPNEILICEVTFYISKKGLEHWYNDTYPNIPLDVNFAINEFSRLYLENYKRFLLIVFRNLVQQYKGFPSPFHLTKKILFCFDIGNFLGSYINSSGDFKIILLCFNVESIKASESKIITVISHELFHLISELHEGEENTIKLITKWQDKLERAIRDNAKIIVKGINEIIAYVKNSTFEYKNFTQSFEYWVKDFYRFSTRMFWNKIADSGLCIIAIELNDIEYIKFEIERDENDIDSLKSGLYSVNKVINHIIENEPNERRKYFLLASLRLLQFMICFENMPFRAIAYHVLANS